MRVPPCFCMIKPGFKHLVERPLQRCIEEFEVAAQEIGVCGRAQAEMVAITTLWVADVQNFGRDFLLDIVDRYDEEIARRQKESS